MQPSHEVEPPRFEVGDRWTERCHGRVAQLRRHRRRGCSSAPCRTAPAVEAMPRPDAPHAVNTSVSTRASAGSSAGPNCRRNFGIATTGSAHGRSTPDQLRRIHGRRRHYDPSRSGTPLVDARPARAVHRSRRRVFVRPGVHRDQHAAHRHACLEGCGGLRPRLRAARSRGWCQPR